MSDNEDDYGADERDDFSRDEDDSNAEIISEDEPSEEDLDEVSENQEDAEGEQGEESEDERRLPQIIQEPAFDTQNAVRVTPPFLTKYEKARVIGVRAMQISKNSPLYLNADDRDLNNWDPLFIAEKELAENQIPFIIRRYLPNGSFEDWKLSELKMLD